MRDLQRYVDARVAEFERRLNAFVAELEQLRRESAGNSHRIDALTNDAEQLRQGWLLAQLEFTQLLRRGR